MEIKNTSSSYGIITKILHLLTAILVITQFTLVYWRDYVPQLNPLNLQLILLHKSIGFTLLFIGAIFVVWRFLNTKPKLPSEMARWEVIIATSVQHSLYLLLLLMPTTGFLMSMLGGKGIKWFGLAVPNLFNTNQALGGFFYNSHVWLSYMLIVLFVLHLIGALKHYFINKNNVLQRMLIIK